MVRTGEILGHEVLSTEVLSGIFLPMVVEASIASNGVSAASLAASKVIFPTFQGGASGSVVLTSAAIKRAQVASSGAAGFSCGTASVKPSNCNALGFSELVLQPASVLPGGLSVAAAAQSDAKASAIANADMSSAGLGAVSTVPLLKAIVLVMRFDSQDMTRPQEFRSMSRLADGAAMVRQADAPINRGFESRRMEVS